MASMTRSQARALSPLDARYSQRLAGLQDLLSEWGLMRARLRVEVEWLIAMSERSELPEVRALTSAETGLLRSWVEDFDDEAFADIKRLERVTGHDVKAVEYHLRQRLAATSMAGLSNFVHFACTSEDINNLAYGTILRTAIEDVWLARARRLTTDVEALASRHREVPMLARTHGQPATPTTLGKELAVFAYRWRRQLSQLDGTRLLGKFNGAVGTFGAHVVAYPEAPWLEISRSFVERFGLAWNPLTTQIEPHDSMAELFHLVCRFNAILLGFSQDMWTYISLGCFRQRPVAGHAGSSTMPHKVNPILFENGEANAGMSTAVLQHLAGKLAVSRLQRDLSDSSALRNVGVGIGHSVVAIESVTAGLGALDVDREVLDRDLGEAWEVLGEAVQTVMRRHGCEDPYERVRELTRGRAVTRETLSTFVAQLGLPEEASARLLALTPATYTGLAAQLVDLLRDG
jgi:adenylosuccinate lyase